MQQHHNNGPVDRMYGPESNVRLSDYLDIIVKRRKLVGFVVGAALMISTIASLLLPKMYTAKTRILPPQEKSVGVASLLTGQSEPLGGLAGSLIGDHTPATLYVGIMKSRSVADRLNSKFNLKERYRLKFNEDVHAKLIDRSTIELSKRDQLITISVMDRDPQLAADLANAYVEMLEHINRELNITQGMRKRLFLEERLKEIRLDLVQAETNLKAFQQKYQLVAIKDQAKVAIEGAAEIKSQIITAQTELEVLKQFGTEKQIEAVMLKTKIEELQKQLSAIGQGVSADETAVARPLGKPSDFSIPLVDLPELSMQLLRLTREAKIQEKLFELLSAQYEMARIEEARDVDPIQVLDKAVPPEKKSGPRRKAIILSSVMISALAAVCLVFLLEYIHSYRSGTD
jgi:tyrosine-protein kinase Etk/Wzc